MKCIICKKTGDEVELFQGIYDKEMVWSCVPCSEREGIPLIRKPTKDQIDKSKESHTVRQRMERMSLGLRSTPISNDQTIVQGNLARLKMPDRKEMHPEVLDDYYWKINMGRRRKKISIQQMSEKTGVPAEVIDSIEKGKIPKNFEETFMKLEEFLGEKLLRGERKRILFSRDIDTEKEILDRVRKKIDTSKFSESEEIEDEESEEEIIEKEEKKSKISSGEMDFSIRRNLDNITLNDLIDMKRAKEKKEKKKIEESKNNALMGDDIDLEIEEL